MAASPHFKLYPSEYYRLVESPTIKNPRPEAILKPGIEAGLPLAAYTDPVRFTKVAAEALPRADLTLRKYLAKEPELDTMTDKERIDFFSSIKANALSMRAAANNFMLSDADIVNFKYNPDVFKTDLSTYALLDPSVKNVSIPIWISPQSFVEGGAEPHMITITRQGRDFEIFDSSTFPSSAFTPEFRAAFMNFLARLTKKTGGSVKFNTEFVNPHGFCDSISCVRAHHKDLPLEEFQKRFISPGLPEHSHAALLKEYIKTELPKTIFSTAIRSLEKPVAEHSRASMAMEDVLAKRMREAYKKEAGKTKTNFLTSFKDID